MFDNSTFGNYSSSVPYTRPQAFMPQQMRRPQISGDQLIKVTGSAGVNALAAAMDANSRGAAVDANDDILYVVTTDGAAYPTVRAFRFTPYVEAAPEPEKEPVYRDEFDSFKNELREAMENVKQLIQNKPKPSTAAAEPAGE